MTLPEEFLKIMREMLGEEYPDYVSCMEQPSRTALRVNTRKVAPERFCEISPFALEQVNWTAKGFYYDAQRDNPARHPYYYAGLYYIQEPSAMIPASLLPVREGDRVLDLCAAPGGKATELAAKLNGTGMLVANDISVSRAMALAKNLQLAGAQNAVITAETPEHLADVLPEYFDQLLIDAPCSGEGMFRRDPRMVKEWLVHGPDYYAGLQRQILVSAYRLLRPGGYMVYSTCTFSPMEDEGMVQWFIREYPDMHICPVQRPEGFSEGMPDWVDGGEDTLRHCVRIFPHRTQGEGHFAVLLQKEQATEEKQLVQEKTTKEQLAQEKTARELRGNEKAAALEPSAFQSRKEGCRRAGTKAGRKKAVREPKIQGKVKPEDSFGEFLGQISGLSTDRRVLSRKKDMYFLQEPEMEALTGLRTIFSGLLLGEQKKNRFEPSPQLALALDPEKYPAVVDLPARDERVLRYLKGETLQLEENMPRGYVLLCVDGYPLGWGKGSGTGMLKNKYYPGWRMV